MKICTGFAALALFVSPHRASAEDPAVPRQTHSGVEAFLLTGDDERNPGDPGAAKVTTIVSLYSLSAASLAVGTVFGIQALSAKSDADDFHSEQPRGFCSAPNSEPCVRYEDMRADQNAMGRSSGLFFGLGALLFLGGATAAQLWANDAPTPVAVSADVSSAGATLTLRGAM